MKHIGAGLGVAGGIWAICHYVLPISFGWAIFLIFLLVCAFLR